MNTYKTVDGNDYTIPGIGRTVNGHITTDQVIENPNFQLTEEGEQQAAPQPPVIENAPAAPQNANEIGDEL